MQTDTVEQTIEKLNALMNRVNQLDDLFETAKAEDDRCTANMCQLEIDEITATLDKLNKELRDQLLDILK